jgi:hypothetical protein
MGLSECIIAIDPMMLLNSGSRRAVGRYFARFFFSRGGFGGGDVRTGPGR